jgi:type I restriction enzyme S subunit
MSEVANIPKHWQLKQLGKVCDKISLNGIKIKQKDYLQKGKFPVVDQGQEMIGGYFNDEKLVVPSEPPYIIFGDHTKVKKFINFKFIAGADGIKVLKPHPIYDPKFFYYLIHTVKIPDKGYARHFQFLQIEEIPIPPLPEQQAIVAKIEELLSDLENGKQQLQTAQQQLKVYRQSLLKWAFEGKLTNKNVKAGELPKGWKLVKIEDVATVGTGATPLKGNNKYYDGGEIAWVTSGALNDEFVKEATDFVTELALKETNLSVYPKNTLLLAMYGEGKTRGKCSELLIKATTNQAIAAIHFKNKDNRVKPFLKYFLLKNYNDIRRLSSGGVQPNLNLGIVKKTLIPLPPIAEQQLIVSELESKLTVCDKIEETISQSLQQAETLRQSILKKAFEGKLVQTEVFTNKKKELV